MKIFKNKNLKAEISSLKKELYEEKMNNEKLRYLYESVKKDSLEKRLKNYKYAILVDDGYGVTLYNDGRFEKFTSVSFEAEPGYIPRLHIRK